MGLSIQFIGLLIIPWIATIFIALIPTHFKKIIPNLSILFSGFLLLNFVSILYTLKGQTLRISYPWFSMNRIDFSASFWVNSASQLVSLLVVVVSFLVQLYSKSYLSNELNLRRYYIYLHLFVGSMMCLILTDQLWIFYGSWELVGAFSYLLISFWHEKPKAIRAAKKAFLLNRLGDIGLLFGLIGLSIHYQTNQFSVMNPGLNDPAPWFYGLAILAGAIGKSAQFPLMSWLPDAMEGPTPASALIHAATMVAAGVFVGIRVAPLFGEDMHIFMGIIGAISLISGALFALFQNDIKKALAYSTISQLGMMWMGMGSDASLLHLWAHGIFKAGLFLAAGYVIHDVHEQRANRLGGLLRSFPIPAIGYLIFGAGMIGLPLTNGFYSKENLAAFLWERAHYSMQSSYYYMFLAALGIGMTLTSFYISRQFYLIFLGENKGEKIERKPVNYTMSIPIIILAILSLFIFISLNPINASESYFLNYFNITHFEIPNGWLAITALSWSIGIGLTYLTKHWIPKTDYQFMPDFWPKLFAFVIYKSQRVRWIEINVFDQIIHQLTRIQVILAHLIAWIDRRVVDGIFVRATYHLTSWTGSVLGRWQSGKVQTYWILVFVTFGLFLLLTLFTK